MSLILEALKKAERQHRLGKVPGLDAAPVNGTPTSSRWPLFLLLLLVAVSMLTLGLYLGSGEPVEQTTAVEKSVVEERVVDVSDEMPVRVHQEPDTVIPAANEELLSEPQLPATGLVDTVAVEPVAVMPEPPPPAPKMIDELPDGFVGNLPSLNIDIHSYDKQPGKRYVLINLQKYREGDYLAEGPRLSEIMPDGVVLEHLGERFILPIGNR